MYSHSVCHSIAVLEEGGIYNPICVSPARPPPSSMFGDERTEWNTTQVEYLVMVCKAAQNYASAQRLRLSKVRDGQHMINQLRDVATDLGRQTEKILAVYDTREVRNSADRLGETLKGVYDLLGDVEDAPIMFGKKRGFGKRVTALVHDVGTRANALLAATSLAIADR